MLTLLSYGLGVESSAVLIRWLLEPWTCPSRLDEIIVLTAQTGDEYKDTRHSVRADAAGTVVSVPAARPSLPQVGTAAVLLVVLSRHRELRRQVRVMNPSVVDIVERDVRIKMV